MLTPFFSVKRFRIRDYLLLDRGTISRMCIFDRINCEFCGYANGTAKLWNDELDELSKSELKSRNIFAKLIIALYTGCLAIFLFFQFFLSKVLFFFIASFLGLQFADTKVLRKDLHTSGYAASHGWLLRNLLRASKLYALSLAINLEQIESAWCPLTHLKRQGAVVSEHHKNFYDRDHLEDCLATLAKEGTVSPRKPRY
eukprot:GAFH01003111.1.p1 GENE.GAFH01003111.1~~GAFH01003111.1.p1  ORF type:complete len:199 (-),score=22.80 GAFH01003111.1:223-819(-)